MTSRKEDVYQDQTALPPSLREHDDDRRDSDVDDTEGRTGVTLSSPRSRKRAATGPSHASSPRPSRFHVPG